MSIPISDLVQVDIAISPNAIATDGFGPLLFMSKEFVPSVDIYPVRSYTSLKEVLADFPGGEIAKAATTWYSQKPTPKTFLVGAIKNDTMTPATPATVTAASAGVLSTIKLETAATLQLSVSGVQYVTDPINFSSAGDFEEVATLVTTALSSVGAGVTVVSGAVINIVLTAYINKAIAASSQIDSTYLGLLSISGLDHAISIIIGALIARATLLAANLSFKKA